MPNLTTPVTRRSVLAWITAAAATPAALTLLAACGGDDDDDESSSPTAAAAEPTATTASDSTAAEPTATTAEAAAEEPTATTASGGSEPTATTAAAATPTEASSEAPSGQVEGPLVFGADFFENQGHLNFALSFQPSYHYTLTSMLSSGLMRILPTDFTTEPALAEGVEVSDDGMVYTVAIKPDLLWPDDEPFTVEDIIFTLDMVLNPEYAASAAVEFGLLAGYEALDDQTVEFTLSAPYAPFMKTLAFHLVPKHILENQDPFDGEWAQERPMGMGPFVITEYRPDEFVSFEANRNYYLGEPPIRTAIMRLFGDTSGKLAALRTNEIHVAEIGPQEEGSLDANVYTVAHHWGVAPNSVAFNFLNPIWANPIPRQALNWAIDRDAVVDDLLLGHGTPAWGPLPNSPWEDSSLPPLTLDLAQVDSLMTGDGWAKNSNDLWEKDGQTFSFLMVAPGFIADAAQLWADDLRRAGFDVQFESNRDYAWVFQNLMDVAAVTWNFGVPADPDSIYLALHSSQTPENGGYNLYYNNPEVDAGLDEGRIGRTQEERQASYNAVQAALREDPAYLWGFAQNPMVAVDKRVSGWIDDLGTHSGGMSPFLFNVGTWTLAE